MSSLLRSDDRVHELLADRALHCVDPAEQTEIDTLLRDPEIERLAEEYELAAALIDPALAEPDRVALPESIARTALQTGEVMLRTSSPTRARDEAERTAVVGRIGGAPWFLAAAALLVAVVSLLQPWGEGEPDAQVARLALLEEPGTMIIVWQPLADATSSGFVAGDIVWNNDQQSGFMRFQGMAANNPALEQYQLWIFDAERDEARPVDGGVFNISQAGEVIVPIDAKLRVHNAAAFAVTVERPGGVVVSDRSRLALLAAPPTGQG